MSNFLDSLVLIEVEFEPQNEASSDFGTGFVVYKDNQYTYIVTCAHVVQKKNATIKTITVNSNNSLSVAIEAQDDIFDIAILKVEGLIDKPIMVLSDNSKEQKPFITSGYYELYRGQKQISKVTGKLLKWECRENKGERVKVWKVEITDGDSLQPGNSGSPVLDENEICVLGIVTNLQGNGKVGWLISITGLEKVWQGMPTHLVDYSKFEKLENYLKNGQWKEADEETTKLMLELGNKDDKRYLNKHDCLNFPKEELRIIDQLWVKYSNGQFGFSVQKQIWLDLGGKIGEYDYGTFITFRDLIGWRYEDNWLSYSIITVNNTALHGHLPELFSGTDKAITRVALFSRL